MDRERPFRRARLRLAPRVLGTITIAVLIILCTPAASSRDPLTVSAFTVLDWFRSVKVSWKVDAPEGAKAVFEIYRSLKPEGPYTLVQEVRLGEKDFFDAITRRYVFYDKNLEVGRRYYYRMQVHGTEEVFGPQRGLASGAPPGT